MHHRGSAVRKRSFSSTLNPEHRLEELPPAEFLIPGLDRPKDKLPFAATKTSFNPKNKRKRISFTSFSQPTNSTLEVRIDKNIPINQLIKDRHQFQNRKEHLKNKWDFVYAKMLEEKKRKANEQKIAKEREEIVSRNRSFRSFVSHEMTIHQKRQRKKKLKSKQQVISQRTDRQRALQLQRDQKSVLGEKRRMETAQFHRNISSFKEKELQKKRLVCDQIHQLHKVQEGKRESIEQHQKERAENNFNLRWLHEYEKRRKAEKETATKGKSIRKNMEKYPQLIKDVITQ